MSKYDSYQRQRGVLIKGRAIKARPQNSATEAWFYENPTSIDIYVKTSHGVTSARITRRQLVGWLKRTERKVGAK